MQFPRQESSVCLRSVRLYPGYLAFFPDTNSLCLCCLVLHHLSSQWSCREDSMSSGQKAFIWWKLS